MENFHFLQNFDTQRSNLFVFIWTNQNDKGKEKAVVRETLQYEQWCNVLWCEFEVGNEGYHRCIEEKEHLDFPTQFSLVVPLFRCFQCAKYSLSRHVEDESCLEMSGPVFVHHVHICLSL